MLTCYLDKTMIEKTETPFFRLPQTLFYITNLKAFVPKTKGAEVDQTLSFDMSTIVHAMSS